MKKFKLYLTSKQISSQIDGKLIEFHQNDLTNVAELNEADEHSVCFYENPKYIDDLKNSKAGLIFVPEDFDPTLKMDTNLLLIEKPYIHFMMLVQKWLEMSTSEIIEKISRSASIPKSANIGKNVIIRSNVVLGENVIIEEKSRIESNCVIQDNVQIGSNCHVYPNTTIYEDCIIKNNVIIHAGCVIGADGFGYVFDQGIHHKVPQVGNVIIEDNVEIGANSTIDRATIGSTVIGKGSKIDNLVQVGHNCKIGENSILCAQVGLAGSTEIGNIVYLAGQVGVAGHLKINDGAMIGAQSGISGDVPQNAKYLGYPAIDAGLQKRIFAVQRKLPEIVRFFNKKIKEEKQKENS